jgi:uncharacterized membrane protein YidH (DUF202 family)
MRGLTLLGAVLVVVGVLALVLGNFSYSDTKPVAKLGPLEVNAQEEHHVSIPTIGGIVVLLAGVGLVFAGRRSP